MPVSSKEELMSALHKSVKDLQQGIDIHTGLIASILEDTGGHLKAFPETSSRPRELRLKEAIREAIEVLDESRKAFKSKRLEVLRKKLTQVLIDID